MVESKLFNAALSYVEKVHGLTERKYKETNSKRFLALNELARKIRVSMNAIHFIPYKQYGVLYGPINLLYRSIITDLMTSLIFLLVDEEQIDDFILIDNLKFVDALESALNTDIEIRSMFHPDETDDFNKLKEKYQVDIFDDLKDCLSSAKGEPWIKKKGNLIINGIQYKSSPKVMFDILKSSKEFCGYAYLYKYYREFSQTEHFSMKGRYMNYKRDFHDKYYDKVLGFIYLGEKHIYEKYVN
ncbi:MAG: hypothetical protein IJ199_01070 [Prevotella sp.]|nr:hypothetical protein [Prevotella sp.]